jgi:AcrR family transcriptional regulator
MREGKADDRSGTGTKERILQSARQVFAERGFDGASTRDIAAGASVNISSLHYHWDSKERLYRAVFADIYRELVGLIEGDVSHPQTPEEARAVIERTMGTVFDVFAADPTIPKLLLRRMLEAPDSADAVQSALGPTWKVFIDWARTFAGGEISPEDMSYKLVSVQASLLVSLLDSPHVAVMLGGSSSESRRRARLRRQTLALVETLMGVDDSPDTR